MTPLTENPKMVLLINENREIVGTATNIAADVEIIQTRNVTKFNDKKRGMAFINEPPPPWNVS